MKANIITIGDEILIGQVIDTNSSFIAKELNLAGIIVKRIVSVGDNKDEIIRALSDTDDDVKIVLITGGLGPTSDDITKPALAEYFGSKMVLNAKALENVKLFLHKRGVELNERNRKQAEVPEKCKIIQNKSGTAPGMWFEKNGKVYVSMPGVPFEMAEMFTESVIPLIKKKINTPLVMHFTVVTTGIPESQMADKIEKWETALPQFLKLAYLPSPGILRLRLSAYGTDNNALKNEIDKQSRLLNEIISDNIIGYGDDTIETIMAKVFKENNTSVSVAESCTGGLICKIITAVPGSSAYFKGGVVAYSNDIKNQILGVKNEDLIKYGAVSEPVVKQMAEGALNKFYSAYSVATSGIAGPDGGTPDKPVGSIWVAVASKEKTIARLYKFSDNRERNILRSSVAALTMLRQLIMNKI